MGGGSQFWQRHKLQVGAPTYMTIVYNSKQLLSTYKIFHVDTEYTNEIFHLDTVSTHKCKLTNIAILSIPNIQYSYLYIAQSNWFLIVSWLQIISYYFGDRQNKDKMHTNSKLFFFKSNFSFVLLVSYVVWEYFDFLTHTIFKHPKFYAKTAQFMKHDGLFFYPHKNTNETSHILYLN